MFRRITRLLRDSPVVTGMAVFSGLLVCFWLSGTLFPKVWSSFWTSSLQLTGLALTNACISGYLVASFGYATRRSDDLIRELVGEGVISPYWVPN